ncbi:MAG: universal stress protein [Pseudomonadota bacterium]
MYKKILVPMALDHGIAEETVKIARTLLASDGEIVALHVHEAPNSSATAFIDEDVIHAAVDRARRKLDVRAKELGDLPHVLLTGHAARTIADYAGREGFDCIVMGSHKPGLSDYLLGSTAARVARHAACAVHIVRAL